jgi:hypothetical protein
VIIFRRSDQRIPDNGVLPPPCTWDYAKRFQKPDGSYWADSGLDIAMCTCGYGHTCRMSARVHRVAADGTVMPSYTCPSTSCSFHRMVRLEGWDPAHVYEIRGVV